MGYVRDFGAKGDGRTDDTQAIQHAADQGDGVVRLAKGVYRISKTITLDTTKRGYLSLLGDEGAAQIVMVGEGPALRVVGDHRGTATPSTFKPQTWAKERMPMVRGVEILGAHELADGVQLVRTMQCILQDVLIRKCRHGVHLVERNRNPLIQTCHIYDCHDTGVFFDQCNLHQAIINGNHISYCKRAGIRQWNGDVHNIQIVGNDIEYNSGSGAENSGEIVLEAPDGVISEYTISSNTLQATIDAPGANVLILGKKETPALAVRLINITGNVLGSRQRNIDIAHGSSTTISGNTIYSGGQLNLLLRDSRHIAVNGNTFATRPAGWNTANTRDGVELQRCVGCSLNGNIVNESTLGLEPDHGAVTFSNCRQCSLDGCQILNNHGNGVLLKDCSHSRISNNSVLDELDQRKMTRAILVAGGGSNLIQGNSTSRCEGASIRCPEESGIAVGNHDWKA